MFFDKFLTTADDALLIPRLCMAEEVDSRDAALPRKDCRIGIGVCSEVAVEKEDRGEEEECHQSERVSWITPKESHGAG